MKRTSAAFGLLLAASSTWVLASPTSILPPGFDEPAAPAPAPAPAPAEPAEPATPPAEGPAGEVISSPVIQQIPGQSSPSSTSRPSAGGASSASSGTRTNIRLPSLEELERMSQDELDEFLGLKPRFDVPPTARRSLEQIGVLSPTEGGFPAGTIAGQPGRLVRAALNGNDGKLVSRWGHILLRRTLASRLSAPEGLGAIEFAALRATVLNRMGEHATARALVQDIDTANYSKGLVNAALGAYLGTGDIVGVCPAVRLKGDLRDDNSWKIIQHVCAAYDGQERDAMRQLDRMLNREESVPDIDILLAQRYGGAAGEGRRAVNIEWEDVSELTAWRHAFSMALSVDPPEELLDETGTRFHMREAVSPAVSLERRLLASNTAMRAGVLSASAGVDLYSAAYELEEPLDDLSDRARQLRSAYVAGAPTDRLDAMRSIWGAEDENYAGLVLTAYAAARFPVDEAYVDDAPNLIASMLSAGLDRNAMRWASVVGEGSQAWGLLALAQPNRSQPVGDGSVSEFYSSDPSENYRKTQFLVAGLAGLGRLSNEAFAEYSEEFGINFNRRSAWSAKIDSAAAARNPALVAMLTGLGMQGSDWSKMTPRHLYKIVSALNAAGLTAEARMIAAEAVARG